MKNTNTEVQYIDTYLHIYFLHINVSRFYFSILTLSNKNKFWFKISYIDISLFFYLVPML